MLGSVQTMGELAMSQMQTGAASIGAPSATTVKSMDSIDKTAQNFEAMFMTQMLQPMFETVQVDPNFGGGHAEEIMRSFLLQEYGKIAAKSGKLGIANAVKTEMIRSQGLKSAAAEAQGAPDAAAQ